MKKKTIYIIDDHAHFRRSLAWMLTGMGYDVYDFENPYQGVRDICASSDCTCLLLDIRMPTMDGLEVHDEILRAGSAVPVVYMTGHGDVALAVEAMKKGAVTFLEKPIKETELVDALERAFLLSGKVVAPCVAQEDVSNFKGNLTRLTPRESEVMQKIVEGKANKVIAFDLGISVRTVELHRARVMKKLPIKNSQDLVRMVMLCH